jgi:hypothetical protein
MAQAASNKTQSKGGKTANSAFRDQGKSIEVRRSNIIAAKGL